MNQTRRQYIRELRPHIATVTLLLVLGAVAGVLLAGHSSFARVKISESLGGLSQFLLGFPKPLLALLIFANNAIKTLLVILFGMAFAIVPLAFVVVNGVAIGLVMQLSTQSRGAVNSFMAVVPHGIFELPGIVLGAGIGLMLGVKATRRLFRRAEFKPRYELSRALRFFANTIVPLLLIGALTEAYITALLVGK